VGRLEDRLPDGSFDLVVSALAVHHLDAAAKADLFVRVADQLRPGGRFVLGDVVVPDDPADAVTPIDGWYDKPSTVADQLRWLGAVELGARVVRVPGCTFVTPQAGDMKRSVDHCWALLGLLGNGAVSWSARILASHCS
jgi:SAM-dependent methyltransferase